MLSRNRKILLSTILVGGAAVAAGGGVFAAFTAYTDNTGNSIASGTVTIGNSGTGAALYSATNQGPGATKVSCIRVTYTGSLASTVKLYTPSTVTSGSAFNLTVEKGSGLTGTYPACTGFTPSGTIYTGTIGNFPGTYATGVDGKGSAWAQGDTVDYRFTASVVDDSTPNAHATALSTGSHVIRWEARNN